MSNEPEAPDEAEADPDELVHVRYIGQTPLVFPVLATRERCCQEHNANPHEDEDVSMDFLEGETGRLRSVDVDPVVLVREGDIFLIDRHSSARDDLELVNADGTPKGPTRADLLAQAEARGIAVPTKATKAEIQALLDTEQEA